MSLWSAYVSELRKDVIFIERDWGFISFSFPDFAPDCVYAEDIYVLPDRRGEGLANELICQVEEAGRKAGKHNLLAIIKIASLTCVESLKAHLAVGFVPVVSESGNIWLKRPIESLGD